MNFSNKWIIFKLENHPFLYAAHPSDKDGIRRLLDSDRATFMEAREHIWLQTEWLNTTNRSRFYGGPIRGQSVLGECRVVGWYLDKDDQRMMDYE